MLSASIIFRTFKKNLVKQEQSESRNKNRLLVIQTQTELETISWGNIFKLITISFTNIIIKEVI